MTILSKEDADDFRDSKNYADLLPKVQLVEQTTDGWSYTDISLCDLSTMMDPMGSGKRRRLLGDEQYARGKYGDDYALTFDFCKHLFGAETENILGPLAADTQEELCNFPHYYHLATEVLYPRREAGSGQCGNQVQFTVDVTSKCCDDYPHQTPASAPFNLVKNTLKMCVGSDLGGFSNLLSAPIDRIFYNTADCVCSHATQDYTTFFASRLTNALIIDQLDAALTQYIADVSSGLDDAFNRYTAKASLFSSTEWGFLINADGPRGWTIAEVCQAHCKSCHGDAPYGDDIATDADYHCTHWDTVLAGGSTTQQP